MAGMIDTEDEVGEELFTQAKSVAKRDKDAILRDHALQIWGELRGIDHLDSATATSIVKAGLERLLAAIPSAQKEADQKAYAGLLNVAKKFRDALNQVWGTVENNGKAKNCRICNGTKSDHGVGCPVGEAFHLAKKVGI